jgi:hypothetical protein
VLLCHSIPNPLASDKALSQAAFFQSSSIAANAAVAGKPSPAASALARVASSPLLPTPKAATAPSAASPSASASASASGSGSGSAVPTRVNYKKQSFIARNFFVSDGSFCLFARQRCVCAICCVAAYHSLIGGWWVGLRRSVRQSGGSHTCVSLLPVWITAAGRHASVPIASLQLFCQALATHCSCTLALHTACISLRRRPRAAIASIAIPNNLMHVLCLNIVDQTLSVLEHFSPHSSSCVRVCLRCVAVSVCLYVFVSAVSYE